MENIAPALLEWFYKNQRILPFRTDPSPYHVWLSEIMLRSRPASRRRCRITSASSPPCRISPRWRRLEEEKLHKLWEGLGYYSRVRNLQKGSPHRREQYGGQAASRLRRPPRSARYRGLHSGSHRVHQLRAGCPGGRRKRAAGVFQTV